MARAIGLWIAGMAMFALALEILFRILPVSTSTATGYYTDPLILTYPAHHRWTASTGWDLKNARHLEANNAGFASTRDFELDARAVALIGDSFVEASMLAPEDRPGAQLESALRNRPVYAAGAPGTALLDYAERIRYMDEKFHVRDFVVLMERGDVVQSLCGSGNVHGPCLDRETLQPRSEPLPPPGLEKRVLRSSALAQYLVSQLAFSPATFWRNAFPKAQPAEHHGTAVAAPARDGREDARSAQRSTQIVDTVASTFFARAMPHVKGRLIIVLDCDRSAVYAGRSKPDAARARFIEIARSAGALVVDTEPLVREHLTRSPLKLDVGPYDGHLNPLGIRLYAQAAAAELARPSSTRAE